MEWASPMNWMAFVGQVLRQVVAVLGGGRGCDVVVVVDEVGVPLVGLGAQEAVVALEAAPHRPRVERAGHGLLGSDGQVPLAQAERVVAVHVEDLGDEPVRREDAPVVAGEARRPLADGTHAVGVVVASSDDARARRRAQARGVEVHVAEATIEDPLDAGRLHQPAEGFQVPEAHVVEHVEQDVRSSLGSLDRHRPGFCRVVDRPAERAGEGVVESVGHEVVSHGCSL